MFRGIILPSSSGSSSLLGLLFLGMVNPEDDGTTILQNVGTTHPTTQHHILVGLNL
jgi:hypothetical protein